MSSTETVEAADQLIHLPLEELTLCPTNPRKHRDEKSLKDLAASIQEKGVLEPIIARPITGAPSAPHFEIVCGERRFL
ncbi:MAG: ParB N-terminal domain-containing protein, partial [Euryarchaeota archaeon]|nr:ParB N-terminal domain-containing protein [Euryarchaeota archaeon]